MTCAIAASAVYKSVSSPTGERLELLRGVNLSVERGEVLGIIGRSGCGKTTLLAVLGLLTMCDAGCVSIAGRDATEMSDRSRSQLRNEKIGFVFQSYSLIPHITAAENVELPLLQGAAMRVAEARRRVEGVLDLVGIRHLARSRPRQLSGGEQQRTAIARALVRSPAVVLADEPTGALDTATADHVLDVLMQAVRERGTALVLVTHDPVVVKRADRVLRLREGALSEDVPCV